MAAGKNTGPSTSAGPRSHQIFCCAFNANGTVFVTGSSDTLARVHLKMLALSLLLHIHISASSLPCCTFVLVIVKVLRIIFIVTMLHSIENFFSKSSQLFAGLECL